MRVWSKRMGLSFPNLRCRFDTGCPLQILKVVVNMKTLVMISSILILLSGCVGYVEPGPVYGYPNYNPGYYQSGHYHHNYWR